MLRFQVFSSSKFSHQNLHSFFSLPYVPHAQPTSFSSICLPKKHLVKSTDHEAPKHAVFSSLLLRPSIQAKHLPQHPILENLSSVSFFQRDRPTDHVSHPYKTQRIITVRQNSIFITADGKQEGRRLWTKWWQAFFAFPLLLISSHINLQAPCVLYIGQAFRYSPENAFYIFNQEIYFII